MLYLVLYSVNNKPQAEGGFVRVCVSGQIDQCHISTGP